MLLLMLWSMVIAVTVSGGTAFLFRSPDPTAQNARLLFFLGLVSTVATLVLLPDVFSLQGFAGHLLMAISLTLPGLIYVSAGLGFRRAWHTGQSSFILLTWVVFTGLVWRSASPPLQGWPLWAAGAWKLAIIGLLLHAISSLWGGRHDDMDVVRRPARYPLTVFLAATLVASTVLSPFSNVLQLLFVTCWIAITIVIFAMRARTRGQAPVENHEKLEELRVLFDQRRIYREDDLTLERIGDRLLLTNDEVRHLIHLGMGFRRLGDLLDSYRVTAARVILEDADQVETRMNEVAISVGYRSLVPFEAAFKRLVGESALQYRQRHLERANANRPLQLTNTDR